jgi:cobalt-zinc-cadmium efflux system outer membrane protein
MKTTRFFAALLAYCAVMLAPMRSYAQQSIDFPAALDLARKNNPDWRAAEQEVEMARGKLTTARLINPFNPVIEGQAGPRRVPGERTGTDYGVGLSMEMEVAGQRGLRVGEAERNLQKVQAGLLDFARNFRAKLARGFYQAVYARERLALQRGVENLNRTLLDVTKIKYQAGDVSGLEVNVSVVRYGQSRKETLDTERNLNQALLELKRLVGVEATYIPQDKLDVTLPSISSAEMLGRALANRPDLLSKRREVERAEAEIALVRRQIFPNPTLGLSFNHEGNGEKTVLGGISIPLPVINRRQGELESLEGRRLQARSEVLALEKEIQKEVNQAINQWETARQGVGLFQREVIEQMDENFRLLEAAYRERRIDLPRLLVMENDLITANQSYLEGLSSLRQAAIQIEEVSGEVR